MRKNHVLAVSALSIAALALTACGGSSSTGGQAATASAVEDCKPAETTVTVAASKLGVEAVQHAQKALEEKYPGLTIEATPSEAKSYDDLTKQIVADAAVGKRPDLIMSGLGQLGFWVDSYNPTPIDPATLPEGYQKQFLGAGEVDGKTYLAPFQISAPVMLVNKKLLADAGVTDPASIKDYDAMLEAARKVTGNSGKPSVNIASDALPDWFIQALVQGAGEKFVAEDGSVGFDTPKGHEAVGILSELKKENLLLPVSMEDGEAQFSAGNLAFHMTTTSRMASIVEKTPKTTDWMPIDVPTLDGAAGEMPAGGNGWVVISEDACAAAYSAEMVNEMLTKEASLLSSGKERSYIPVNKLAADELLAGADVAPQTEYAWTYSKPMTVWGGFDGTRTAQVNDTIQAMMEKLSSGASADEVVPAAAKTINGMVRK